MCQDYQELMGFRILQSIGASPTIAIASAVVADIVTAAERGSYAALDALPVLFAPTLGPVLGGLLTQYLGWRFIFWFLLIAGALAMLLIGLAFPETCRVVVGDASAKPPKRYRSVLQAQDGAVMAASNLTRCALGAVAFAAIQALLERLGLGWTYVVFGVLFIACSPMLLLHYYKGLQSRQYAQRREAFRLAAAEGRPCPAPRSPRQRFFAKRTDKLGVKAAAMEALVTAPAIPLVEMKPEVSGRNSASSRQ